MRLFDTVLPYAAVVVGVLGLLHECRVKATEYLQIDRRHIQYCDEYANRSGITMAERTQAYGDCIRILPERLPMPVLKGSVPATDRPVEAGTELWKEQCRAEYRTWDEDTGTVVRKGNPERVKCPCGDEVVCGE